MVTVKYIVLKVVVDHDINIDPADLCHEVKVSYDNTDGFITESEVVQVLDLEPGSVKSKSKKILPPNPFQITF